MTLNNESKQVKIIAKPRKGTKIYDYELYYLGKVIKMTDGLTAYGLGVKVHNH